MASASAPSPAGVAPLAFGTRLGPNGDLFEIDTTFALGEVVVWQAELAAPIGGGEVRFQVIERRADGRDLLHWDEPFVPPDPAARTIVAASDLALYAHDGPGTYVIRYVRGGTILAEGAVTLVAGE